ncbi:MAG TPA: 16S rRNA (guanine(966)-N(2))-methyltransferase RsmD [Propionibacteriaceae bacterium]|nr:16S rRNA (guanine(966)-N(2))-methyltransferase RsmD [Propionibacteriaceae bacterium]
MRVIAGSAGGRRLMVPRGDVTRPTTDRVREALFSAITSWAGTSDRRADLTLAGLAFCDLYAGSGAIGLEAASRGANPVLIVEADRRIASLAVRNARELSLSAKVQVSRVESLIAGTAPNPFDIVFADPPYDMDSAYLSDLLTLVVGGWVTPPGLVIVERSRRSTRLSWPVGFARTWQRTYGETVVEFGAVDSLRTTEGGP